MSILPLPWPDCCGSLRGLTLPWQCRRHGAHCVPCPSSLYVGALRPLFVGARPVVVTSAVGLGHASLGRVCTPKESSRAPPTHMAIWPCHDDLAEHTMDILSVVEVWLRLHGRERAYGSGAFFDRDQIQLICFSGGVAARVDLSLRPRWNRFTAASKWSCQSL